jgi:hypothetical protein
MNNAKLGQTQIVSVLLIIVIALGAVSTVVPWANNMIQKKKDAKNVDDIYNFFQTLDSAIRNIAENGGEESLTLKVPGKFSIYPSAVVSSFNNSIVFVFNSKVSNIAVGDWIPLNTANENLTAPLGLDPSGVILGKAEIKEGNIIEIQYRLWYRELIDTLSNQRYKIVINPTESIEKNITTGFMRIQRLNSYYIPSQSLTITEINIIV